MDMIEDLYAVRDTDGRILRLDNEPQQSGDKPVSPDDPALKEFLRESDLSMIRVVEDIVDLLIDKQLIRFTDLPDSARSKLLNRRTAREVLKSECLLLPENDIL